MFFASNGDGEAMYTKLEFQPCSHAERRLTFAASQCSDNFIPKVDVVVIIPSYFLFVNI